MNCRCGHSEEIHSNYGCFEDVGYMAGCPCLKFELVTQPKEPEANPTAPKDSDEWEELIAQLNVWFGERGLLTLADVEAEAVVDFILAPESKREPQPQEPTKPECAGGDKHVERGVCLYDHKPTQPEAQGAVDGFIREYVINHHTCKHGLLPCDFCEAKAAINRLLTSARLDSAIAERQALVSTVLDAINHTTYSDMNLDEVDSYDAAFEQGAEVLGRKILAQLQAERNKTSKEGK